MGDTRQPSLSAATTVVVVVRVLRLMPNGSERKHPDLCVIGTSLCHLYQASYATPRADRR